MKDIIEDEELSFPTKVYFEMLCLIVVFCYGIVFKNIRFETIL